MGRGGSVHCGMLGNFIICKVCRVFCWTRQPYKCSTSIFPTWGLHSLQLSKMKQNEKTALVHLAFPINAHQNAIQKPIGSVPAYRAQCTLPPQLIYQTLLFNFLRVWFRHQRSVGMHAFNRKHFEIRHSEITSEVIFFFFFLWGRPKIRAIPDKQNFNSCYTSHCEVMVSKWAYYSLQEQCLLTLSIYSSLKFNFSKLCMEGVCGACSHSTYFAMRYLPEPFTKIHKLGTNSSKVDQVPTIVLPQDVSRRCKQSGSI